MDDIKILKIKRLKNNDTEDVEDSVIVEYPLTLFINDREFITLHCTPRSLTYLAAGFLFSEGIINGKCDIEEIKEDENKGRVYIYTKEKDLYDFVGDKLYGKKTVTTACGKSKTVMYGIVDFFGAGHEKLHNGITLEAKEILALVGSFNKKSKLFIDTGGVHSCALCDRNSIIRFEEDVGRHNALDKVLGYALLNGISMHDKIILTSGRISSEMVIKVLKGRCPVLVSRSAPTDISIELAVKFNLTLVGFVRGERMNIYTNLDNIK